MSESVEQRQKAVQYWFDMAQESMDSAHRELEAGALSFAINRLYYAAFYALSAVLLERNASFDKHTAVRAALHRDLIRAGVLDQKWGKLYNQLFEDRQQGDYMPFAVFERSFVDEQLQACESLLVILRGLVTKE